MRVFVAVPCRVNERFAELSARLGALDGHVNPVPPENAHLTLKFLGEVPDVAASQVADALREAVRESATKAFQAQLVGVGVFPRESHPRVVWVGVDPELAERVDALANAVDASLGMRGYPREKRAFHAHATVARIESLRDLAGMHRLLETYRHEAFGTLDGTVTKVMKSRLTPRGAVYEEVHEVPLP